MLKWNTQSSTIKTVSNVINDPANLKFNDARLNNIAMLTWNINTAEEVFSVLNKSLNPSEVSWKVLLNTLLCLRTIVFYGSEKAIDLTIELCPFIYKLQDYNSALVKNKLGFAVGGSDFGGPVREESKILYKILVTDSEIRKARSDARAKQGGLLVPLGDKPTESVANKPLQFGAGLASIVGASHSIENVPGLYNGRPERYFDSSNDPRRRGDESLTDFSAWTVEQNSNFPQTSGKPSSSSSTTADLLDLVFNGDTSAPQNLPEAQYLPALQRQAELEKQLAEQQEQLRKFQVMQQQQQQQQHHHQQQQFQSNPSYPMQQAPQNVPIMSANMASMPPMQQMQPMPNIMGQNMPPNYYQNNNLALNMNALPINNTNLLPEPNLPPPLNAMYSNVSINHHNGQNFMPAANPNLMMSNNSSQFLMGSQQQTFNMNANMNATHLGTQNMMYGQPPISVYGIPQGNKPSMNSINSSMSFQYPNANTTYPVDDDAPSHAPPPPPPMSPSF